ncbi:unnamed protein product [Mortierella alpina]
MSEAALTSGPVAPSLGSSLLPHHNSTTTQIGPSPALTDLQRSELERYMSRDALFLSAFEHQRQMQLALLNEKQLGIRQIAQSGARSLDQGIIPLVATALPSLGHMGTRSRSSIQLIAGEPENPRHLHFPDYQSRSRHKRKTFWYLSD